MTARIAALAVFDALLAAAAGAGPEPLPADPPIGGFVWSIVVPAILFVVASSATWLLYRHFAGRGD